MTRAIVIFGLAAMTLQQPTQLYRDSRGRFTFFYPLSFGSTTQGTNDGFQDRIAAIGFAAFPAKLRGEAVFTRGFPLLDLQAAGGLYDAITLEIFPAQTRALVVAHLPRLTVGTLCEALERPTHLDPSLPAFASLPPEQRTSIRQVDVLRNINPHLVTCRASGDVVVFDKERSFSAGAPVQHVYGAVRFLPQPYSTFHVIGGGDPPTGATLGALTDLVKSFKSS
jgi:hypothetical protein